MAWIFEGNPSGSGSTSSTSPTQTVSSGATSPSPTTTTKPSSSTSTSTSLINQFLNPFPKYPTTENPVQQPTVEEQQLVTSSPLNIPFLVEKNIEREEPTQNEPVVQNPVQNVTPPSNLFNRIGSFNPFPERFGAGQDVTGNQVTPMDILQYSKNAPSVYTQEGKIAWAKKQLIKDEKQKTVQPLESKTIFGYRPYQKEYTDVYSSLDTMFQTGSKNLSDLIEFKQNYPEWKKQFDANKLLYDTGLKTLESGKSEDIFWIDVNRNAIQEENEFFKQKEAISVYKQGWIIQEGGYKGRPYDEWMSDVAKSYKTVNQDINTLRADLNKNISSKNLLMAYEQAGYKITKTDKGFTFSQPSAKEVHEYYYGKDNPRILGVGLMEAFPTILPISTIWAGVSSLWTGGKAWSEYEEGLYQKSLNITMRPDEKGVNVGKYAERFWHPFSKSGVGANIYLPLATMGAGYIYTGLSQGGAITGGSKIAQGLSKVGTTNIGKSVRLGMKSTFIGVAIVGTATTGISLGLTASQNPSGLNAEIGNVMQGFGQAMGGWYLGSRGFAKNIGKPKINPKTGRMKGDVTVVQDTLVGQPDDFGEVKFMRKAVAQSIVETTKGSITYKTEIKLVGKARPISDTAYSIRAKGITVKHPTDLFAQKLSPKQMQNLFKTGVISQTESYGVSEVLFSNEQTKMNYYYDKGVSGIYGKNTDVSRTRGFTLSKPYGKTTKVFDFKNLKVAMNLDVSTEISSGIFQSRRMSGVYRVAGKTSVLLEEKPNVFSKIIGGGSSINKYQYKFKWGTVKYESSGDLKGLNKVFTKATDVKGVSTSSSGTGENIGKGGGVTETILKKFDLKSVDAKIINIGASAGITYGASSSIKLLPIVSKPLSLSKVKNPSIVNISKPISVVKQDLTQKDLRKPYNIIITEKETGEVTKTRNKPWTIIKSDVDLINKIDKKPSTIVFQDTGKIVGNKTAMRNAVMMKSGLALKTAKTFNVGAINTPTIATIIPFVPLPVLGSVGSGGGGGGGLPLINNYLKLKKKHGVKLLFKEVVLPNKYLKGW